MTEQTSHLDVSGRVLLVDDSALLLEIVAEKLVRQGLDVVKTQSARTALETATKPGERFDLFVLDVVMPEMDGFELSRWLRRHPATRDTPILLLTSLESSQDKIHGLEAGADDFLTKTVTDAELVARVRSLISLGKFRSRFSGDREVMARLFHDQQTSPDQRSPKTSRVLLLHDDPEVMEILRASLTQRAMSGADQLTIRELPTGSSGDRISSTRPDVILCTYASLMNADSPLRTAVLNDPPPGLVVIDGEPSTQHRIEAFEQGVDDYLERPTLGDELGTPLEEVAARVFSVIRRRRQYQKLQSKRDQAVLAAITDPLTGLYNRGYFEQTIRSEVKRAERYLQPVTLAMLDIDHFKRVNDKYGHPVGDQVLRQVAERTQAAVRDTDIVARFGGEEMAIILPQTDRDVGSVVAERIRAALEATPIEADGTDGIRVTCSIGVATCPTDALTSSELVDLADAALYRAKRSGRNRVRCAAKVADTAGFPAFQSGSFTASGDSLRDIIADLSFMASDDLDSPLASSLKAVGLLVSCTDEDDPLFGMTQQLFRSNEAVREQLMSIMQRLGRLSDSRTPDADEHNS